MSSHKKDSIDDLSPAMQAEVMGVRGLIAETAEKNPIPDRFTARPGTGPRMIIADTETGRETEVSLYAYGAVRSALNELFGEQA